MVHKSLSRFLVVPLLVVLLMLQGCALSVTSTLQLVIAAAEAAVSVVSPEYAAVVNPYLKAVSAATSFAATELASGDSSPVKAEKIIAQFATIAAPNLPAGVPQTIVSAVLAVTTAVANFLASIAPAAPAHAAGTITKAATVPKQIKVTVADAQALDAIKARADTLTAKIK